MTDPVRVTLRVPPDALDELKETADAVGLGHTVLYPVAFTLGMRILARQLSPEKFAADLRPSDLAHRDELRRLLKKALRTK